MCSFPAGLQLLMLAIEKAGYTGKVQIGMDVAASEFCKEGKYDLDFKNPKADPATFVSSILICTHVDWPVFWLLFIGHYK